MTFRWPWSLFACSVVAGSLILGCSSEVKSVPITGTVKFNSQPVEIGLIEFYPIAPTIGAMAGSPIEKGAYSISATNGLRAGGKYSVQITASRKTGKKVANIMGGGAGQIDLYEQYLPAKYNKESKLEVTLSAPNQRKFDFDLTGNAK